jgi:Arc/MetJ-type ribon-helix-helix transcriptional regulator
MARNMKATTLSVTIPVTMAQVVYDQVREGRYASASEVVRAALQQMLKLDASGGFIGTGDDDEPGRPFGSSRQRPRGT